MAEKRVTISDLGYTPGQLPAGPKNSILDVPGVYVGQETVGNDGDAVRKGVTVIFPRHPEQITTPCYAGLHTLNGNGEVTGSYQIKDWGYTNTPIAITNSLSLGITYHTLWQWTLQQAIKNKTSLTTLSHAYGTPVVGETADWLLNDVYSSALSPSSIDIALANALTQTAVQEGQHGGGAGMTCHMFPGGTGTSSRVLDGYTVGVLCQTNYGHKRDLSIGGVPVGKLILREQEKAGREVQERDGEGGKANEGSIVVVLITDAPLLPHQLVRVARHCAIGLTMVGGHGVGRNHSGDIMLALSTGNATDELISVPQVDGVPVMETNAVTVLKNESMDGMFKAASEATEEAILNSLVAGRGGRTGFAGLELEGLPVGRVTELLKEYLVVV